MPRSTETEETRGHAAPPDASPGETGGRSGRSSDFHDDVTHPPPKGGFGAPPSASLGLDPTSDESVASGRQVTSVASPPHAAGGTGSHPDGTASNPILSNLLVAAGFYTFDVLVVGQVGFLVLASLVGIIIAVVRTAKSSAERRGRRAMLHAAAIVVLITLATVGIASVHLQARLAQSRGERIVLAVKEYRGREGHYPTSLDALVPAYLPSIPRARYTLAFGEYHYFVTSNGEATLGFTTNAPFGRMYYSFARNEWGSLD